MEENTNNSNKKDSKEAWWRPAIIVFAKVSGWIGGPIIVALFVGKHFDQKYGTEPWIFLILTIVAFTVSMFGIGIIAMRYMKEISREEEKKKNNLKENGNK